LTIFSKLQIPETGDACPLPMDPTIAGCVHPPVSERLLPYYRVKMQNLNVVSDGGSLT